MDYQITVRGEQKGPYSLSQLQSMWNSGTITSDSLYWDTEAEEWKPVKELIEPSLPPALNELAEHDEESWHVHDVAPPVLNEPSPQVLNQPVPPKSRFKILILGIVVLIVIGLTVWGLSSLLTERPNQELSEAEKKKQKEYQEAIARESDKLAPTAKEHDKDKRFRDAVEKRRRDRIVGTWKNSVQRAVFQTDGTVEMYTKEGGKVNYNLTWKMAGDEIHVTVENGVIFIYRVLNNGSIQSYAAIDASGKRSSFIGSPLNKTK